MSAGGQNSSSLSGIQAMRLRDSADVTTQIRLRMMYQQFNATSPNAINMRIKNSYNNYLQFLEGVKEVSTGGVCPTCTGLPYNAPSVASGTARILAFTNL